MHIYIQQHWLTPSIHTCNSYIDIPTLYKNTHQTNHGNMF